MSYPFRTILCPVDFSENSLAALDLARQMATSSGGVVHVVHVVPTVLAADEADVAYHKQEEAIDRRLEDLVRLRLGAAAHVIHVPAGEVAKEVARVAREMEADVVVIATHGRSGLSRLFLGSVAEKIIREAPCPVLSVRIHDGVGDERAD